jgi:hypothetical protein
MPDLDPEIAVPRPARLLPVVCDLLYIRRRQDDHRHARSTDPSLRHHRDRQHQLAIQNRS